MNNKFYNQIVPPEERYCFPAPNEVKFISNKQTLSLVLGSCISTVFIGKNQGYIAAANHIVIANPGSSSIIAKKSAQEQIDEIVTIYQEVYGIEEKNLKCFHLLGGGSKNASTSFNVNLKNIEESKKILKEKKFDILFADTHSYYVGNFSITDNNLSVFIENKILKTHITFAIDLDRLFSFKFDDKSMFPAVALEPDNKGFEYLVNNNIIIFITGARDRSN